MYLSTDIPPVVNRASVPDPAESRGPARSYPQVAGCADFALWKPAPGASGASPTTECPLATANRHSVSAGPVGAPAQVLRLRETTNLCRSTKASRMPPVMMVRYSGRMVPSFVMIIHSAARTKDPTTEPST